VFITVFETNVKICCVCTERLIEVKPYLCTVCDKRYRTKHELNTHRNIHSDRNKSTERGTCSQGSKELKVHRRIHPGQKPLECYVCNKRFTTTANLAAHSKIHSGENPHECNVCSKQFTSAGNLAQHRRIHSGEKPFKCQVCDRAFSQSGSLKLHTRKHTGEKPYRCHICERQFSSSGSLNRHMSVHKLGKPYRHTDGPCTTECDSGDLSAQVQEENLPVVKQEPDDTHVRCAYLL